MNKISNGITAIVIGLICLGLSFQDVLAMIKTPQDGLVMEIDELHAGDHLEMDITTAYDYIISETTTETRNGKTISSRESSRYYGVPVFYVEDDMVYIDHLLLIQVGASDFSAMDRAVDRFDAWWDDESGETEYPQEVLYHANGRLKPLSSEDKRYVAEYFETSDYEDICPSYVLVPLRNSVWVFFGIGAGALVLGIVLVVLAVKANKREKEEEARRREQMQASGYYDTQQQNITFNNGPMDNHNLYR